MTRGGQKGKRKVMRGPQLRSPRDGIRAEFRSWRRRGPEECELVTENRDGSLCAHIPVARIKISSPAVRTEAQRAVGRFKLGGKKTVRFEDPKAADSSNKGEVWGKIDGNILVVNRDVLLEYLNKSGFDYTAVSKKWSEKGYLVRNSQGKFIHSTRVYGIKSSYIKLNLLLEEDKMEEETEFVSAEFVQGSLPFD